jgi:hypothetical protein
MICSGATATFSNNNSATWINDFGIDISTYTSAITGTGVTNGVLDLSTLTAGTPVTITNTFTKASTTDIVVT